MNVARGHTLLTAALGFRHPNLNDPAAGALATWVGIHGAASVPSWPGWCGRGAR